VKLFIYEMICGGGSALPAGRHGELEAIDDFLDVPELVADGASMLRAVCMLCHDRDDIQPCVTVDQRLTELAASLSYQGVEVRQADPGVPWTSFRRACQDADQTMIIAPELGGLLQEAIGQCRQVHGNLVGPAETLLELGVDKLALHRWADKNDVRMPWYAEVNNGAVEIPQIRKRLLYKPQTGTGGMGVRRWTHADKIPGDRGFMEQFVEGIAVSVSAVFTVTEFSLVPPWHQELGGEGGFQYVGGQLLVDESTCRRASEFAFQVFSKLPTHNSTGWISLDLIVSADDVFLIELNTRITSSFEPLCNLPSFVPYLGQQSTNVIDLMGAAIRGKSRST